jgi:hypothetical protein
VSDEGIRVTGFHLYVRFHGRETPTCLITLHPSMTLCGLKVATDFPFFSTGKRAKWGGQADSSLASSRSHCHRKTSPIK